MIKIPLKDGTEHEMSAEFYSELNETYYDLDFHLQKMRLWCLGVEPKHRKTKTGANRFIVNWLNRSAAIRPRGMPLSVQRAEAVTKGVMPEFAKTFLDMFKRKAE